MKSSTLSEIKEYLRQAFVFVKVEKYLRVDNRWLLDSTGKAFDQAHKATQLARRVDIRKFLNLSKKWWLDTPERALANAYQAASVLRKIESEHLAGEKISSVASYGDSESTYFEVISKRYLLIIQVRLLEFKVSNSIVPTSTINSSELEIDESCTILGRLNFIDSVLSRYKPQQVQSSVIDFGTVINCGTVVEQIHLPDPEIHDSQMSSQQPKLRPQAQKSQPRSSQPSVPKNKFSNVGLASILFAGGFATGGTASWAVISAQNPTTQNPDQLQLAEAHLSHIAAQLIAPSVIANPSIFPPKLNVSESTHFAQVRPFGKVTAPVPAIPEFSRPERSTLTHRLFPQMSAVSQRIGLSASSPVSSQEKPDARPSLSKKLTSADLKGLSSWELTLLRNEIYARHGRQFIEPELQHYFDSQSWYQPRYAPQDFPISLLSATEHNNAILIREYQRAHGLL